jgi:hypothetical protein
MFRGQLWRRMRSCMARVAMALFVGCLLFEMGMLVMMLLG